MIKIFSVLDTRAGHFLNPFSDTSSVQALRGFEQACGEPNSAFNRHPDDFALMELAEFEPSTGTLNVHAAPVNLASARSMLRRDPNLPSPGYAKHEKRKLRKVK